MCTNDSQKISREVFSPETIKKLTISLLPAFPCFSKKPISKIINFENSIRSYTIFFFVTK